MAKKTGTSTGAIETSNRYRRRRARQRRAEEAAWAALAGPVIVYGLDGVVRPTPDAAVDVEQRAPSEGVSEPASPSS